MKSFFAILLFFVATVVPVYAVDTPLKNAGFAPSNIWYSRSPFFSGDSIRIYTIIFNGSSEDLIGVVEFLDNGILIGKTDFSLASGGRARDVWVDWVAKDGKHTITARLSGVHAVGTGGKKRPIVLENIETAKNELAIDFDTDRDGIGNTDDLDDDNDNVSDIDEIKNIQSRGFGTFEEYSKSDLFKSNKLTIIKPGSGTRSSNIELLNTQSKKRKYAHKISRSFTFENFKLWVSKIKTGRRYTPMSNNRCKFIIQNFIPDLKGDYRILAYGDKYYCVYRENRKDDFRASGSGKLNFEITPPKGLLDYSKKIYEKFNTPFMSLDIGYRDGKFYLFEFQCLCLGQYTLEKSSFHYKQNNSSWKRVYEKPDLEREVTKTIIDFIKK